MKYVLAALFAVLMSFAAPTVAQGKSVGKAVFEWGSVEIFNAPCPKAMLDAFIVKEKQKLYKRAETTHNSTVYAACWAPIPKSMRPNHIFIFDKAGKSGPMDRALFNGKLPKEPAV